MIAFVHVQSLRLASGEEALVARVLAKDGRAGYGFSFRLDAAEARHMAEWNAGVRPEWQSEPAFAMIRWLPE